MTGTIIKGIGGFYYVKADDGVVYECKARGKFRKDKITPMIGDKVKIEVENQKGNINEIFPRSTMLMRPPVANIDTIIIVVATTSPEPNLLLIDKMLVMAEYNNIKPIICINKIDLSAGCDLKELYQVAGYDVVEVSAEKNDGLNQLLKYIEGHTTAFAGLSGVGKSTILGILTGLGLETGEVSDKIQRGKHTTRHVELIEFKDNSFVLDTPGFSSLEIDEITANDLGMYFPEIAKRYNMCKFRGCAHISEPECEVLDALDKGEISLSRYESYKELYSHLKTIKEWEK